MRCSDSDCEWCQNVFGIEANPEDQAKAEVEANPEDQETVSLIPQFRLVITIPQFWLL